jgi:hypothetical protein
MFKSILALIPSERPVRPVVDGSVVLAMACHAHVNALAIGYESTNISIAAIAGPATDRPEPEGAPGHRYDEDHGDADA